SLPGDVTIPPLRNSYRLVYSVKGLARLVHQGITTLADTLYPSEPLTTTICSGRIAGIDTVSVSPAANPGSVKWQPVYITPSSFSRIVLTPAAITDAAAGETRMLTVEKRDKYGNHIDWGLAGGEHRRVGGAYPGAIVTPSSQDSLNDLHSLVADTLSTGHNHGGTVSVGSAVGVPGAASVGGAEPYNATIAYTAAPAGIDTQMIYVSLGGNMDTSVVCSAPTGDPKKFLVSIDTTAALDHNAGDSVAIRFAPFDSTENHVYSYFSTGQTLKLDHVSFNPVADKDTTYYFTYEDIHGGWHKVDGGSAIIDTLNHERGESVVYVHVFATDDSAHTITVKEGNIGGTSPPMIFHPLDPTEPGAEGKWTVEVTGPLNPTGPFEFTIIPRDRYFNRWRATRVMTGVIVNISSNLMGEFDTGSNPKVISGPTPFTGTLSGASGNLVIYVFNNTSDRVLGKSKPIALTGQAFSFGDLDGSGDVTAFDAALILRYLVGDTTFTPAQVGAADVSGDGTVTAYDASLILRYVAGDTGVHLGTTAKGKHFPSSSISGVGSVFIGETQYGTDGALNVPVMLSGARSVHGIELVLNIGGSIDVKGVTINPPSDWLSAYRVKDGILKVAMSGATPLAPGCMANISASLLRQDANVKLTGDVVLNENAKQSLGEIKLAAMPTKFGLDQNYPNPFNPSTTIGYQLPASSEVSLKIYDVLGREVAVLVNRRQNAGVYKVEFDGSKFAGGVYFCRIVVHGNDGKSFVATKKLVLAK
ncbi:MAG: dockerin type I domain-containing protein, partial [Bacteroidetes bacterium]|nr:dockerin type I domain-containing protein [Bacteroidota bacterium]